MRRDVRYLMTFIGLLLALLFAGCCGSGQCRGQTVTPSEQSPERERLPEPTPGRPIPPNPVPPVTAERVPTAAKAEPVPAPQPDPTPVPQAGPAKTKTTTTTEEFAGFIVHNHSTGALHFTNGNSNSSAATAQTSQGQSLAPTSAMRSNAATESASASSASATGGQQFVIHRPWIGKRIGNVFIPRSWHATPVQPAALVTVGSAASSQTTMATGGSTRFLGGFSR